MDLKQWIIPFLLLSFLFIVILTVILYRIMWIRLEAIIRKNKEKEEQEEKKVKEEAEVKKEKEDTEDKEEKVLPLR